MFVSPSNSYIETLIYNCSSGKKGLPVQGKFAVNSMRLKKSKGKELQVKRFSAFILTVVTGSSVHVLA